MQTNKKSIFHNLRLIIPGVDKTGALKTWVHFSLDERYWQHLISGLDNSSTSTPPAPPHPNHQYQPQRQGKGKHHQQNHRQGQHQPSQ